MQIEEHVSGPRKNRVLLLLDCLQLADDAPDVQLHIPSLSREDRRECAPSWPTSRTRRPEGSASYFLSDLAKLLMLRIGDDFGPIKLSFIQHGQIASAALAMSAGLHMADRKSGRAKVARFHLETSVNSARKSIDTVARYGTAWVSLHGGCLHCEG
jgi:hypothetical protein